MILFTLKVFGAFIAIIAIIAIFAILAFGYFSKCEEW
jgi:hypothetical protein